VGADNFTDFDDGVVYIYTPVEDEGWVLSSEIREPAG
jgi:hypothetical protein